MAELIYTFDSAEDARTYLSEVSRLWVVWIIALAGLLVTHAIVLIVWAVASLVALVIVARPLQRRAEEAVPENRVEGGKIDTALRGGTTRDRALRDYFYGTEPLRLALKTGGDEQALGDRQASDDCAHHPGSRVRGVRAAPMNSAARFGTGLLAGLIVASAIGLMLNGDNSGETTTSTTTTSTLAPEAEPWIEPGEVMIGATAILPRELNIDGGTAFFDYDLAGLAPSLAVPEDTEDTGGDFAVMPEEWLLTTTSGSRVTGATGPFDTSVSFDLAEDEEVASIVLTGWRVATPFGDRAELPIETGATATMRRGEVSIETVLEQSISTIVQVDFDDGGDPWVNVVLSPVDTRWRVSGRQGRRHTAGVGRRGCTHFGDPGRHRIRDAAGSWRDSGVLRRGRHMSHIDYEELIRSPLDDVERRTTPAWAIVVFGVAVGLVAGFLVTAVLGGETTAAGTTTTSASTTSAAPVLTPEGYPEGFVELAPGIAARSSEVILGDDTITIAFTTAVIRGGDPFATSWPLGGRWLLESGSGTVVESSRVVVGRFSPAAFTVQFPAQPFAGETDFVRASVEERWDSADFDGAVELPFSGEPFSAPETISVAVNQDVVLLVPMLQLGRFLGQIEWEAAGADLGTTVQLTATLLDGEGAVVGSYDRFPEILSPSDQGAMEIFWGEPFPTDQEGAVTVSLEYRVGVATPTPAAISWDLGDVPTGR